jgi:hypothetical protein
MSLVTRTPMALEIDRRDLTNRPRPSEGQFFGQVGDEHFVSRCDETKWCTFRAFFVGERGYQTLLLRLSLFLRNVLAACGPFITPDKYWRKITWPEFQPSLPPGLLVG